MKKLFRRIIATLAIGLIIFSVYSWRVRKTILVNHLYRLERILDMDDVKTEVVLPQLREILTTSENIMEYAAAQALFCIGSPEAHAILTKHLLSEDYNIKSSIRYAFHWQMEQSKRDAFITQYHLQSLSKGISIELISIQIPKRKGTVEFLIILKNTSDRILRLYKPYAYLGQQILLISSSGHVMRPVRTHMFMRVPRTHGEAYPEIPPGEELIFFFKGEVQFQKESGMKELENTLLLNCGDFDHKLDKPGKYKVYALYYVKGFKNMPFDNIWEGRIVSEPVEVNLKLN